MFQKMAEAPAEPLFFVDAAGESDAAHRHDRRWDAFDDERSMPFFRQETISSFSLDQPIFLRPVAGHAGFALEQFPGGLGGGGFGCGGLLWIIPAKKKTTKETASGLRFISNSTPKKMKVLDFR